MLNNPYLSHHCSAQRDACTSACQVRTLGETVRLDARTKLLNPKWYEGMMSSGYEGVREIQKRLTNTMGWSATSGMVSAQSLFTSSVIRWYTFCTLGCDCMLPPCF